MTKIVSSYYNLLFYTKKKTESINCLWIFITNETLLYKLAKASQTASHYV